MSNPRIVRAAIALAVLALAIAGYFLFVPITIINSNLLKRLVVPSTGLPTITATPTFSASLPSETSSLAALTAAVNASPGLAGAWSNNWFGSVSSGDSASVQAELLPTRADAVITEGEASTQDLGAKSLKASLHTAKSRFTVPGGAAVLYSTPRPAQKSGAKSPPVPGAASVYSFGRVVVRISLTGAISTKPNVLALGARELAVVKRTEPKFPNLATTDYPVVKSLVYWAVSLVVIIFLALLPDWIRAERERRRLHELARQRRQYQVRGSKALRRHRVRI